ncbi:MAG: yabD, partial [Bacillales bacterium]|nr:yabD [Bacillales bacterium]
AIECVKMNFYISLAGPLTFKNARLPKEVVERIPLENLLIETDCPYLAPHPHRGKRNEPAFVKLVAEEIALIKNQTFDTVAKVTTENAKRLFRLKV